MGHWVEGSGFRDVLGLGRAYEPRGVGCRSPDARSQEEEVVVELILVQYPTRTGSVGTTCCDLPICRAMISFVTAGQVLIS